MKAHVVLGTLAGTDEIDLSPTEQSEEAFGEALHGLRVGYGQLEVALPGRRIGLYPRRLAFVTGCLCQFAEQLHAGRQQRCPGIGGPRWCRGGG
jgi:hypothetical protein